MRFAARFGYVGINVYLCGQKQKPKMAGIYIHIPFCKSRCVYCDFFSTTQLARRGEYVDALIREWQLRSAELPADEPVQTVYFGGGTPSLQETEDLQRLLEALPVASAEEITLECNPGDVTPDKAEAWRSMGINRLSMGIQSFDDTLLRRIGRRHTAAQAREAVRTAQAAGFGNISIDLIYGLPMGNAQCGMRNAQLGIVKNDVEEAMRLGIQHISTYCLTYEDGTPLMRMLERGEVSETDEDTENVMYDYIADRLQKAGFVHYEVSNFALSGFRSRHNSRYWDGTPYLGLGAGAHSYDGRNRSWNPDDLDAYLAGLRSGSPVREKETLSETDRYNECIMLGLRTSDGVPYADLHTPDLIAPYIERGLLQLRNGSVIATQQGLHILNRIIEDLME